MNSFSKSVALCAVSGYRPLWLLLLAVLQSKITGLLYVATAQDGFLFNALSMYALPSSDRLSRLLGQNMSIYKDRLPVSKSSSQILTQVIGNILVLCLF